MKQNAAMLWVVASVVLSACAQLFMKVGMLDLHGLGAGFAGPWPELLPAVAWVLGGLGCYALSMMFWLAALTRYELSMAYPLLSLSYVLVYLGAVWWPRLGETVSFAKTAGIVLIVLGVVLVTRTAGSGKQAVSR
jgi:undecaprenyl phosphate-alpha-L-ara4N flippase subunit ArnF